MVAFGHLRRRWICTALTVALLQPTTVMAAPSEQVQALHGEGQAEVAAGRAQMSADPAAAAAHFVAAGDRFVSAAMLIAEVEADRSMRDDLLRKGVSAYQKAHSLVPADLTPLRTALALLRTQITTLEQAYGEQAGLLPEYMQTKALITQLRARIGVEAPVVTVVDEPERTTPELPKPEVVVPPPQPQPQPQAQLQPSPKPARADWRRVGLGVSGGLAGLAFGVMLGTAFMVARKPFKGPLYAEIEDAASEHGVPHTVNDDMCSAGAGVPNVVTACDARDRMARASLAMLILTGVSTAAAITFGVLLARSKRTSGTSGQTSRQTSGRTRRHAPGFGAAPLPGGVMVGAGARF